MRKVQDDIWEAKRILVHHNILSPSVISQSVIATDAASGNDRDWNYYMAAKLFE